MSGFGSGEKILADFCGLRNGVKNAPFRDFGPSSGSREDHLPKKPLSNFGFMRRGERNKVVNPKTLPHSYGVKGVGSV